MAFDEFVRDVEKMLEDCRQLRAQGSPQPDEPVPLAPLFELWRVAPSVISNLETLLGHTKDLKADVENSHSWAERLRDIRDDMGYVTECAKELLAHGDGAGLEALRSNLRHAIKRYEETEWEISCQRESDTRAASQG